MNIQNRFELQSGDRVISLMLFPYSIDGMSVITSKIRLSGGIIMWRTIHDVMLSEEDIVVIGVTYADRRICKGG
jgi:hypothetical protein